MKLATNIHHVIGICWNGFQGQRSKVKVIRVQVCECYNGGGIDFDGVTSLVCWEIQIRFLFYTCCSSCFHLQGWIFP